MKKIIAVLTVFIIVGCNATENAISFKEAYLSIKKQVKAKDWAKSEVALNKLIKRYPKNAELYFKRGYVKEMNLKYHACLLDFTKALKLDPKMLTARTNRGFAYRKLKKYKKAIIDFSGELIINPNPYSYEHRSMVYYLIKDYEKALKDINKSIDLDPLNSISYKTRALIYKAIRKKKKACLDIQKAMELNILNKYPRYNTDINSLKEYCLNGEA